MKYQVGQWLTATQKAADHSPKARTFGKAYQIKEITSTSIRIINNWNGSGAFSLNNVHEYFKIKENELWDM